MFKYLALLLALPLVAPLTVVGPLAVPRLAVLVSELELYAVLLAVVLTVPILVATGAGMPSVG